MYQYSLLDLSRALHAHEITSTELTHYFLNRINQSSILNAFITVDEEKALQDASHADHLLKTKKATRLTGIPLAHKDNLCTKNRLTTCGSKILSTFNAPYNATLVQKLHDKGAVLMGKTNLDEFAMGSSNESSYFGPVKNPWDLDYVPGGSSGGSAAAIAAGLIPFATGSDTGGSIRQPAAFCGISGLKPTYGLISRMGLIAYASSLDQAGPMARSAESLALVLEAMAGFDEQDSTSLDSKIPDYVQHLNAPLLGKKIGLPTDLLSEGIDEAIQQAVGQVADFFRDQGAHIIPITLALTEQWTPCYYLIALAEASSNLSRYDGIRYGYRAKDADNWIELIRQTRTEGFGQEVKRRILAGTYFLSAEHHQAHFVQAQKVRHMIHDELNHHFKTLDFMLMPTTPTPAFCLNETDKSHIQDYACDRFTVAANLAGLPALSIPAGFDPKTHLPLGVQLMGPAYSESLLLNAAHLYQQATTWH
ncbi:MAG: Asp-tRNA(Asn)/Glu-tRNA(Gln) amidotransferase subunit GatA, partial [Legionellaceae bacterium]